MITVERKDFIKQLTNVKEDNIGIAGVAIDRKKLLTALKIQTADVININYGQVSWQDSRTEVDQETCIQFQCDHQTFRFLDRPKVKYGEPQVKHLNFIEQVMNAEPKLLTGTPIDTVDLLDALTFTIHGVATEEGRPVLCCVLFDSTEDGILKIVAADGFRLPLAKIQVEGLPADRVSLHSSDIAILIKFLKGNTTGKGKSKIWLPVYLEYGITFVRFSSDLGQVEFKKQPGNFPNYEQLIPQDGTRIDLIASQVLESVKAVSTMARDGSGIIRMVFADNKLTLSAHSEELGDTSVDCDAIILDSECKIAANGKYLIDLLRQCGNTLITLRIKDPSSPMVFTVDNRTEVIMPMFVQW